MNVLNEQEIIELKKRRDHLKGMVPFYAVSNQAVKATGDFINELISIIEGDNKKLLQFCVVEENTEFAEDGINLVHGAMTEEAAKSFIDEAAVSDKGFFQLFEMTPDYRGE